MLKDLLTDPKLKEAVGESDGVRGEHSPLSSVPSAKISSARRFAFLVAATVLEPRKKHSPNVLELLLLGTTMLFFMIILFFRSQKLDEEMIQISVKYVLQPK